VLILRYRLFNALGALAVGLGRRALPFARWRAAGWPTVWLRRAAMAVLRVALWARPEARRADHAAGAGTERLTASGKSNKRCGAK
jgi:hypothetical protein